jgi:hypothetical protein
MSYKISISSESADALFNDILIRDFNRLGDEINELENLEKIENFQSEDLIDSLTYRAAMKTLLGYYLTPDKYRAVTGEELYPDAS